jgi:arginase
MDEEVERIDRGSGASSSACGIISKAIVASSTPAAKPSAIDRNSGVGFHHADQEKHGSRKLPASLRAYDLAAARTMGVRAAAEAAVAHVARDELAGFFVHVDADVLHDDVMPAVDYRMPDGLAIDELKATLQIALESGKAVGIEVTIYHPKLDADGLAGRALTALLSEALRTGAP